MPVDLDALAAKLPELLLEPVVVVDESGRFVFVNTAFERVLGYAKAELIGRPIFDLVHPEDRERTRTAAEQVMQAGSHVNYENRYLHRDGHVVHLMWSARWSNADGVRIAVARDVTALKRSEAARDALYRISEAAHAAESLPALCESIHRIIAELLPAGNFYVALLDEASRRLSYPYFENEKEPARGAEPLLPGTAMERVIRSGQPLLTAGGAPMESDGAPETPDPRADWLGVPLLVGERVTGAVVVESGSADECYTGDDRDLLQFVSTQIATAIERTRAQDRLRHMAHHDALTGLPNRALFYDRFDVALRRARRDRELVALLYLDLDDFKSVNDAWGHHAGDLVLIQLARRLLDCVRESDTVARMGGDEFTVLLTNIAESRAAETAVEKIRQAMSEPFDLGETSTRLTASIGVAIHPDDGEDAETLLRRADAGMYGIKRRLDA